MKELWVEKYRPNTIDGYVFRDAHQKEQVQRWINERTIPHLLFSGNAGIGKTTLAKILFKELDANDLDVLEINASRTNSVEDVRDKIVNFVQMIPFGDFKIVLLDEADYLSPNAQAALRGVMETYHTTARFILTCNYPNRIIPALHSRCQGFHIERVDITEFTARVATILMNSLDGKLHSPEKGDSGQADYKIQMVQLFKAGKISEARKLICSQARPEEMEEIYRWLYDNITIFGEEEKQNKAILIIKQGLVDHTLVIDPEINLAATLIRLAML